MKKIYSVLFVFFTVQFFGCSSQMITASPGVLNFFGEKITGIITGADKGYSCRVKPEKTKNTGIKTIEGYPLVEEGPALSADDLLELKNILLDEKTYDFKYAKKAFVFPEYAFVLVKGNEQVTVFFDFYRKEVLFVHEGRELVEDFDNAEKDVRAFISRFFK